MLYLSSIPGMTELIVEEMGTPLSDCIAEDDSEGQLMWKIFFTKQADKDKKKLKAAGLDRKAKSLIEVVKVDPFGKPHASVPPVPKTLVRISLVEDTRPLLLTLTPTFSKQSRRPHSASRLQS
ncbi:MAG: hypothetical protein Q4A43_05910 [Coriobacteriia bacterium]|nr:hypothetical protein [Coriobacteriia bacterium]